MEEIEILRKENEELKKEIEMIENFYGENKLFKRIKFYLKYIKEKWKNANYRNSAKNETTRNNTIFNNSDGNTWNNEVSKIFNN